MSLSNIYINNVYIFVTYFDYNTNVTKKKN